MKVFLQFLLMLAIIAALVLWWSPELRRQATDLLGAAGLKTSAPTLYKWQNAQGVWQYTQDPPPAGVPYSKIEARPDVNVLPLPDKLQPGN